ncbi:hypothetical protein [Roseisolibacter sp. H3M3-2]|uniref:hypothetical protein n=1 Tax=Roseisolibacter sp. H3M3-2 TaxID=3031323 RepID=UPI0023DA486B|nr:hypothetical protein [Roseisolibacter sp. H3M3-2]MDF1505454.1 hypothetical protein [Roseisolibacter sp. H3M3-2]
MPSKRLALALLLAAAPLHAQAPRADTLRVLFVGNSFTYFHNLPRLVEAMAATSAPPRPLAVARVTMGGWTLRRHAAEGRALAEIRRRGWDYVVLQEQSLLGAPRPEPPVVEDPRRVFYPGARTLAAEVRAAGATPLFFLTWARRATPAADAALATVERRWRPAWSFALPVGVAHRESVHTVAGDAALVLLRLDRHRFLAVAGARASTGAPGAAAHAERRVGRWLRLVPVVVAPLAALTAGGPVVAPDGVRIRGGDVPPDGWACEPGASSLADVAVADPADTAAVHPGALAGPLVVVVAGARDDARWSVFGDDDWDGLARRATVVVPAGASLSPEPRVAAGDACVVDGASWGEPRRGAGAVGACSGAAPVVHLRGVGVTRIVGPARAQGVLLVDGDLEVVGDVEFAGVVLVRGALRGAGASLRVTGALLVRHRAPAAPGDPAVVLGPGSVVARSSCAVAGVTLAASRIMPLGRRGRVTVTP